MGLLRNTTRRLLFPLDHRALAHVQKLTEFGMFTGRKLNYMCHVIPFPDIICTLILLVKCRKGIGLSICPYIFSFKFCRYFVREARYKVNTEALLKIADVCDVEKTSTALNMAANTFSRRSYHRQLWHLMTIIT